MQQPKLLSHPDGNTKVSLESVIIKQYKKSCANRYFNEKYYYKYFSEFAPKLIGFNNETLTLVIEACTPIMEVEDSRKHRQQLRDLLHQLHYRGANHRDIALSNVVVKDGKPLLIDWESATTDISDKSIDLYGHRAANIKCPWPNYGPDGIYWNGPWDISPGRYWDGKKKEEG